MILTIAGAFLQNIRSLLQRKVTDSLSINGASFVRFFYAIPFAFAAFAIFVGDDPKTSFLFFLYVFVGGVAQIIGTSCLIAAVVGGNFSVGTTLSKTEAVQAALFGLLVLGDRISLAVAAGIGISLLGVILLTANDLSAFSKTPRRALRLGLISGSGFAVAAVCFRGASLSLGGGEFIERAAVTVLCAVVFQSMIMGTYLKIREPGELNKVLANWKVSAIIGGVGMIASLCWFSAMTLNNAAIVRAVGQVELLFTLGTTLFWFKEQIRFAQYLGIFLVVAGIWLLI